jgi:hypothetical protein
LTGAWDLNLNQGADYATVFTWTSGSTGLLVDLTGWSAHLQIRDGWTGPVILDLSSTSGGIILGGAAGTITVAITNVQTAALNFGTAGWDLKMTNPSGQITRLLQGLVFLAPEVTV